jgi:4-hydroxy-3-polyprenylbenzoate decarboxylase
MAPMPGRTHGSPPAEGARVALLVSGASGMALPCALLRALAGSPGVERVHLTVSAGASQVLRHELAAAPAGSGAADLVTAAALGAPALAKVTIHRDGELDAVIASGSYRLAGTAIVPCSSGTLGALATGSARTLVHRAGAVALKERWPLVIGFRETPLSVVHLENLRVLAYAGAHILPPMPAFYLSDSAGSGVTEGWDLFLEHYALRVLDRFGLTPAQGERPDLRWAGSKTTVGL